MARLDNRWRFVLPAGTHLELHIDAYNRTDDVGYFWYVTDGATWTQLQISWNDFPFIDSDVDVNVVLPSTLSGTVFINVTDVSALGGGCCDSTIGSISVDHIYLRAFS